MPYTQFHLELGMYVISIQQTRNEILGEARQRQMQKLHVCVHSAQDFSTMCYIHVPATLYINWAIPYTTPHTNWAYQSYTRATELVSILPGLPPYTNWATRATPYTNWATRLLLIPTELPGLLTIPTELPGQLNWTLHWLSYQGNSIHQPIYETTSPGTD